MDIVKTLFVHRVSGGSQLNRDGIMALLSDIYDVFGMEAMEILSFKSRGETIKEWWDVLDNTELLTWDVFEKKGKAIISTLPETEMCAEMDDKTGKFVLVSKAQARKMRRNSSGKSGKQNVVADSGKVDLNRTYVPSSEIVKALNPYLEKKEPSEETVRPWLDYIPLVTIWVNNIIAVKGRSIPNFESGFSDGLTLIAMIEVLSGVDLKGYIPQPSNHVESFKNITLALKFATHFKIDVHPVTHSDVYYGIFEKLIVLLVRIGEKWVSANIDDRKGKVSSSPLVQSNTVELKVDQKEQDEIYRLASLAQTTKRPERRLVSDDKTKASASRTNITTNANIFVVDMGPLGREEIPYQQTRALGDVLQELCKKHNISDINSYIASTCEGSELFLDSMLGEIPKQITFLPAQSDSKGTLADLINKSDAKAQQKRLQQVSVVQRNYDVEDEDEMQSRKRQLERANAFDKVIDDSISNIALENMRKEYEKLMDSLQLDKLREEKNKKAANKKQAKPASKIQDVDLKGLDQMVSSLDSFQKAYGTSEAANNFFAGVL